LWVRASGQPLSISTPFEEVQSNPSVITMPLLALSEWSTEFLRCTAFTLAGASQSATNWWTRLTGSEPEQITSNPRLGASQAVGQFGPGNLVVSTQADRVDWFLTPVPIEAAPSIMGQPLIESFKPASIGSADEAFTNFLELSQRWLAFEEIPKVNRLALGGALLHQEQDKRAAYERLPNYVPVQLDPESSDFLLQINLPMQSRLNIEGLTINRLSKWAVLRIKTLSLNMGSPRFTEDSTIALRSEIDINTAQEYQGELPKDQLSQIMDELVEHGRDIIANGVGKREATL
jgi:hypothetical protein